MTLQELENQILKLPISDRWHLVESVLASIQEETSSSSLNTNSMKDLDPWTQSLLGIIQLNSEDSQANYIDYLEEKYQ